MIFRLFPRDFEGVGCLRVLYPYGFMEAHGGHECTVEVGGRRGREVLVYFPDPEKDEADGDVYVFQCRWETVTPGVIDWVKSKGKFTVFEMDDYCHGMHHTMPALEALKKRPDYSLEALTKGIQRSDLVTVSTPMLAEMYGRMNPNIEVIPNYLRWSDWSHLTPNYEKDRRVRVGWQGWLKMRGEDLSVLRGIIRPFLERNPHVDFVQVGDSESVVLDYLEVPEGQRLMYQGQIFPKHAAPTSMIDIGLVPLQDSIFNECKSHLKGMEYAACGAPCIASPTEAYRGWVEDGVNGFLAKRPKDWIRYLELLVNDDALRREMGRNAYLKAQQHTLETQWRRWDSLYGSTLAVAA